MSCDHVPDDHVFIVQACEYPADPEAFQRFLSAFASAEGAWREECGEPDCLVVLCAATEDEALRMLLDHYRARHAAAGS